MDELLRNGSGYVDLTAYKAIKNTDGGVKMKQGEIWEIKHGKKYKMAVVIAVHERACNVLVLNDERVSETDFEVIAKGVKYTDPTMISYAFNNNFTDFIKSMKEHEFETLLDVVRGELGFNGVTAYEDAMHEKINELNEKVAKLIGENSELKAICEDKERNLDEIMKTLNEEIENNTKLTEENLNLQVKLFEKQETETNELQILVERNFYKEQYEKLFERMIG